MPLPSFEMFIPGILTESVEIFGHSISKFTGEFWTPKQRQASSLHEISYRACFKPQLPRFFIERLTEPGDVVYDPFSGRGTTAIEAAFLGRNVIANDVNPLSRIISAPRLFIPNLTDVEERLRIIPMNYKAKSGISLGMFYHKKTLAEIVSIRKYLLKRISIKKTDEVDRWIQMVATNRLTGHSSGFFSVYTLPPNQAVSASVQRKINRLRRQKPPYRDTREIILRKSRSLIRKVTDMQRALLRSIGQNAFFTNRPASDTPEIREGSVQLTVTSPPFLNVVQYASDNWLRCWFNGIDARDIAKKITMSQRLEEWQNEMQGVFAELYRVTKIGGWVTFEVGEIRGGKIRLEESIVPLGIRSGFRCAGVMINEQHFTKTANIWGISNNQKGTNSNRIVLFQK